ncbi:hypothetical protein PoMZ_13215 [Pyricularia oryzae]|uniref:Uncharacterized protein n=1 Tax=Pyricularia oryzae TaxID=318829 RepID=A0A4P7NUZ2_PYROR|nr:hypothetical protein PoMZ_13215 [Pyricularia oryzae]
MITLEESRISGGDGMEPPVKALSELRDEFPFQDARQQILCNSAKDYSLPLEHIFTQFTQTVTRRRKSLAVLGIVENSSGQRLDHLSSCVSNYTSPDRCPSYTLRTSNGVESTLLLKNFPYRPLPGLEFRDGGTFLVPRGKLLDVIGAVGPTLPNKPTFMPGIAGIADVLRTWESLVITVADGFDGRVSDTHKPKQPGETKFL